MAKITRLEAQKRDPERVSVYLDDRFAFGASVLVIMNRNLCVGMELSETDQAELETEDSVERTYNAALNFLSFRPRSRREVEGYFRRRKADPAAAETVVDRLEHNGLLNDREFARFWVENRQAFRPRSTMALRAEMRQKGLGSEVINEALADLGDEAQTAYEAGRKRARAFETLDDREFFRKMVAFLQRRGFPYDTAAAAAKRLARAEEE